MKIGITYLLFNVTIKKLDGTSRNISVNKDNLNYLISLLDNKHTLVINAVNEYALVERGDSDSLDDYFDDKNWL